jgi:hypothetical protein
MVAAISGSTVTNWSDSLFSKLDTKKQGYVDQSDLASALGTDEPDSTTTSDDAAAMIKQIDGDGDGKITKSELSSAISRVSDELNAQFDSSRVDKSQVAAAASATGAATPDEPASTDMATDEAVNASSSGSGSSAGAARAAPPAGGGGASATSSSDANKYVQAADTDVNGTVSDDEAAAYKKLMAAQAEHAHAAHKDGKPAAASSTDETSKTDSDRDLARALDMLKQYTANSGDTGSATSTSSASTVDVTA